MDKKYYGFHTYTDLDGILKDGLLSKADRGIADKRWLEIEKHLPTELRAENCIFLNYSMNTVPSDGGSGLIFEIDGNTKIYDAKLRTDMGPNDKPGARAYVNSGMTVAAYEDQVKAGGKPFGQEVSVTPPYFFDCDIDGNVGQGEIVIHHGLQISALKAILVDVSRFAFHIDDFGMTKETAQKIQKKMQKDLLSLGWSESSIPVVPVLPNEEMVYGACFFDAKKYIENRERIDNYLQQVPFYGFYPKDEDGKAKPVIDRDLRALQIKDYLKEAQKPRIRRDRS